MIISTFSGLPVPEVYKEEIRMMNGEVVNFKYPEVVADHQKYRVTVYKHNALRHDGGTKSQIGLGVHGEPPGGPSGFFFFHSVY